MAIIPLKDEVTLTPPGAVDAWGNATGGTPVTHDARIDEKSKLVRNQNGDEVVSNTQILIDKIVAVDYDYDVTYTDATGNTVTKKPIAISRIKDLTKVIFTRVDV